MILSDHKSKFRYAPSTLSILVMALIGLLDALGWLCADTSTMIDFRFKKLTAELNHAKKVGAGD